MPSASTGDGGVAGIDDQAQGTPPPTSAAGTPGAPGDGTLRLALVALAALLATLLLLTPATGRS
ncbi:MAG: hypothetical protein MUE82_09200 [Chloroflexi bacterium]|jgi:hypothetical protein|nr:hypothetical protein [Chloroflexota bacterium]